MDPLSLSVGMITLFQETYLLSASDSDEEREDVAANMRWELLMLESFGRWFKRAIGVLTDDSLLDERWLCEIQRTLTKLRRDFNDFTRLAVQENEDYRLYSPWHNEESQEYSPYLVDCEYSGPECGTSFHFHAIDKDKVLYRHLDIQGEAYSSFSKLHDIYSLGVVLLEIALWQTAQSMLDELEKRNKQHVGEEVNAYGLQKWYVNRTKKRVAHLMGASYQGAVMACLEFKFKDQARRRVFPTTFDAQVTQKLSAKQVT